MAIERTVSVVKPDTVAENVTGQVYSRFEQNGLRIVAAKMKHLSVCEAQDFYAVHKERPFYADLVAFMTSEPVIIQMPEGEDAVVKNRGLMGATGPANAAPSAIRVNSVESLSISAVHGSDNSGNAAIKIPCFFSQSEICPR